MSASTDTRLTPELIIHAYRQGLFPMADAVDDPETFWVDPHIRGIIPLDAFHVPRRLARTIKQAPFDIRIDTDFRQTIEACRMPAMDRPSSWINDEILSVYCMLHRMGYAHSVECWSDDKLVGGLYGVRIAGAFFGESMFSGCTDASKIALTYLVARLRYANFSLLDCQFATDHLTRFGLKEVPRTAYHRKLQRALGHNADFQLMPVKSSPEEVLQAVGHKS
ncbi:MAG TPA: leucyl/phenylalanyl-tRNA--protein transferase [Rhodobiaceae bacterium]|nr:leucyl/phenylalanyl-tRNA--protein transferase [Rhodobiaceae bacterium]